MFDLHDPSHLHIQYTGSCRLLCYKQVYEAQVGPQEHALLYAARILYLSNLIFVGLQAREVDFSLQNKDLHNKMEQDNDLMDQILPAQQGLERCQPFLQTLNFSCLCQSLPEYGS